MHARRQLLTATASLLAMPVALRAFAAGDHGKQGLFTELSKPQPVVTPGKAEVIEFFWYGCPHCHQTEPLVETWEKTLGTDVVCRREHVMWEARSTMVPHANLFITLRTLGILGEHHRAVFEAIHVKRNDLRDNKAVLEWAAQRGIDRAKFESTYQSFGVNAQFGRTKQLTRDYAIESVPTFVVNGRYATSPHQAGGGPQMFAAINQRIALERGARKP